MYIYRQALVWMHAIFCVKLNKIKGPNAPVLTVGREQRLFSVDNVWDFACTAKIEFRCLDQLNTKHARHISANFEEEKTN